MSVTTLAFRRRARALSVVRTVHLWLALTLGLFSVTIGLTGSLLTFYPVLDRWLNPALGAAPGTRPGGLEAVYRLLLSQTADDRSDWNIEIPPDGGVVTARYLAAPTALHSGVSARRLVSVDPGSLTVVRDARWGGTMVTWIYEIHQHLLLGARGIVVVGIIGAGLFVLALTGVVIWWPAGSGWRRFSVDLNGSSQRWLYDVHKLVGIIAAVPLLLVTGTGVLMCVEKQVGPFSSGPAALSSIPRSIPRRDGRRVDVDRAVDAASRRFPVARVVWVQVPRKPDGTYMMQLRQPGETSPRFPHTYVWVDQYSGEVLAVVDPMRDTVMARFWNSLFSLHNGDGLGWLGGRVTMLIVGALPLVLFVTGSMRWWERRTKSASRRSATDGGLTRVEAD